MPHTAFSLPNWLFGCWQVSNGQLKHERFTELHVAGQEREGAQERERNGVLGPGPSLVSDKFFSCVGHNRNGAFLQCSGDTPQSPSPSHTSRSSHALARLSHLLLDPSLKNTAISGLSISGVSTNIYSPNASTFSIEADAGSIGQYFSSSLPGSAIGEGDATPDLQRLDCASVASPIANSLQPFGLGTGPGTGPGTGTNTGFGYEARGGAGGGSGNGSRPMFGRAPWTIPEEEVSEVSQLGMSNSKTRYSRVSQQMRKEEGPRRQLRQKTQRSKLCERSPEKKGCFFSYTGLFRGGRRK